MKTKGRRQSSNIEVGSQKVDWKEAGRAKPKTVIYGSDKMLSGMEKRGREMKVKRVAKKVKNK